jgi:DNA-binding NtrC family response regulator
MIDNHIQSKQIFIVERQHKWREFSGETLKSAGYLVKKFDDYDELESAVFDRPDLIIVGCSKATLEEIILIKKLHHYNLRQLVLSTFLSWSEMRDFFLAGADDVAEKPFNSQSLLKTVSESFDSISIKERNMIKEYEVR